VIAGEIDVEPIIGAMLDRNAGEAVAIALRNGVDRRHAVLLRDQAAHRLRRGDTISAGIFGGVLRQGFGAGLRGLRWCGRRQRKRCEQKQEDGERAHDTDLTSPVRHAKIVGLRRDKGDGSDRQSIAGV